jgi:hypothetical protein
MISLIIFGAGMKMRGRREQRAESREHREDVR